MSDKPAARLRKSYDEAKSLIESKTIDGLTAAVGICHGYPLAVETLVVAAEHDAGQDWRQTEWFNAYDSLEHAHIAAASLLIETAERFGMDGSPIALSARLCRDMGRSEPYMHHAGVDDDWPSCLGSLRWTLPDGQQRIIADGETAFSRLIAKCDIDLEEPSSLLKSIGLAGGNEIRVTAEEADAEAKRIAKDDPAFVKTATVAAWAKRIGCHRKTVEKSTFITKCVELVPKKPVRNSGRKAVGLTDGVLMNEGRHDNELQRLIEEQEGDYEPSPVSERGKNPRVFKTL